MQTLQILAILALLAAILILWIVKRYLIRRKRARIDAAKPVPRKSGSTTAAAASRQDAPSIQSASGFQASETNQPVVDRRQPGVVDRRHHAVGEQKAEPAPAVVREPAPAAVAETARAAEAPKAEPAPAAVREETPAVVAEAARTAEAPKAEPEPAPAAAREALPEDWLPEDSVLRRHYLTQMQAEREALSNPYPTDSTLRRHYDAMVKIQMDGPSIQAHEEYVPTQEESRIEDLETGQAAIHRLENEIASERESASVPSYDELHAEAESEPAAEDWVPEDSVLRRHYLANLQAEREALTNPYPTDSTLRRHYETMIRMALDWPPVQAGSEETPAPQESAAREQPSSRPVSQSSPSEAKAKPSLTLVLEEVHGNTVYKMSVPEDSVLRRHFLTNLQAEIESELPECPTDSVLKRHHDAMVCAKMEERLERMQA